MMTTGIGRGVKQMELEELMCVESGSEVDEGDEMDRSDVVRWCGVVAVMREEQTTMLR